MQDFDDQHPRVRVIFALVALLIVVGGLWLASSFIWPEDNGQIAILKADNTPYKVKPDDKGGMQIPHQDKMIFNALSPDGKPVTVERILPGPEQPLNAPQPNIMPNADPIVPIPTVVNQPPAEAAPQPVETAKPVEKSTEKASEKMPDKSAPLPTPVHMDAPTAPVSTSSASTVSAMGRVLESVTAKPSNQPAKPPAAFDISKGEPQPIKKPEPPPVEKAPVEKNTDEPTPLVSKDMVAKEDEEEPVDAGPKSKARLNEPKKLVAEDIQEEAEQAEPPKKLSESRGRFQIASFFDRASADKAITQFKTKYADELDGAALTIATATINGGRQVFRVQGAAVSTAVAGSICSGIKAKGGTCVTIK